MYHKHNIRVKFKYANTVPTVPRIIHYLICRYITSVHFCSTDKEASHEISCNPLEFDEHMSKTIRQQFDDNICCC